MRVEIACTLRARLRGLLGRTRFEGALLLVPCSSIHTVGMKRPIDVAFVDIDGVVVASCRSLGPNRRLRSKRAYATLERFAVPDAWYEPGDRLQGVLRLAFSGGRVSGALGPPGAANPHAEKRAYPNGQQDSEERK